MFGYPTIKQSGQLVKRIFLPNILTISRGYIFPFSFLFSPFEYCLENSWQIYLFKIYAYFHYIQLLFRNLFAVFCIFDLLDFHCPLLSADLLHLLAWMLCKFWALKLTNGTSSSHKNGWTSRLGSKSMGCMCNLPI